MKRYRLENGRLVPPPKNGVCHDGTILSGFGKRVEADGQFAQQHGYYPLAPMTDLPKLDKKYTFAYTLQNGVLVRTQIPRKPH